MRLLDNKTGRVLITAVPLIILIALIIQFSSVYASNNTNSSETIDETITNLTTAINNETLETNQSINITPINNETIEDITTNKSIKIILNYNGNTPYDENNDGIESVNGVIDFAVDAEFNWNVREENLCTRWNIFLIDTEDLISICYGSEKCCNFVSLVPSRNNWKDVFYSSYGQYGATYKNTISAQVIYVDYNMSIDDPSAKIYYSKWASLSAEYSEPVTNIFTKIKNLFIDKISAIKGAIIKISATLVDTDDNAIPSQPVNLYLNETLIDTELTDILGFVEFKINTSLTVPGEYLVNLSFDGFLGLFEYYMLDFGC